jgi:hypothetical protein
MGIGLTLAMVALTVMLEGMLQMVLVTCMRTLVLGKQIWRVEMLVMVGAFRRLVSIIRITLRNTLKSLGIRYHLHRHLWQPHLLMLAAHLQGGGRVTMWMP